MSINLEKFSRKVCLFYVVKKDQSANVQSSESRRKANKGNTLISFKLILSKTSEQIIKRLIFEHLEKCVLLVRNQAEVYKK